MADCKYGDPTCPCQDGDLCHYEGDNPMNVPPEYVRAAVQAEREACATIADAYANQNRNAEISFARQGDAIAEDVMREVKHEAEAIAAAIRARGKEGGRMNEWKQYKRKGLSEMRPYVPGEDLSGISVSPEDSPETDLGMIARNPENHKDQWYVARAYFEANLDPA